MVFWVATSDSVMVGYQSFEGPCRLHLQGEVLYVCILPLKNTRRHNPEDLDFKLFLLLVLQYHGAVRWKVEIILFYKRTE